MKGVTAERNNICSERETSDIDKCVSGKKKSRIDSGEKSVVTATTNGCSNREQPARSELQV